MFLDDFGRLILAGGDGLYSNPSMNLKYDGTCDGWVKATVHFTDSSFVDASPAWFLCGPPKYSPFTREVVSLYELIAQQSNAPAPSGSVVYERDILPSLTRTKDLTWLDATARTGHGSGAPGELTPSLLATLADPSSGAQPTRTTWADRLAVPNNPLPVAPRPAGSSWDYGVPLGNPASPQNMPRLIGYALTQRQYDDYQDWKSGSFVNSPQPTPPASINSLPASQQPEMLVESSLVYGCGGSFCPGIEACGLISNPDIYKDSGGSFVDPFRIELKSGSFGAEPGDLTRALYLPWQFDFQECGNMWWPSSRPTSTTANGTTFNSWVFPVAPDFNRYSESTFILKQPSGDLLESDAIPSPNVGVGLRSNNNEYLLRQGDTFDLLLTLWNLTMNSYNDVAIYVVADVAGVFYYLVYDTATQNSTLETIPTPLFPLFTVPVSYPYTEATILTFPISDPIMMRMPFVWYVGMFDQFGNPLGTVSTVTTTLQPS